MVQPCIWFKKQPSQFSMGQTLLSITCSIVEKLDTGLDECPRICYSRALERSCLPLSLPRLSAQVGKRQPPLSPATSSQERGNTGRKEDYRWHGSWLKSGAREEERSARFTWNISCQRGKRGGHSPARSPPTYSACPSTPTQPPQHGPSTPRSPRSFKTLSGSSLSSLLFQLSFRSFIFPPAHHYLRRCPDRQTGARAASA